VSQRRRGVCSRGLDEQHLSGAVDRSSREIKPLGGSSPRWHVEAEGGSRCGLAVCKGDGGDVERALERPRRIILNVTHDDILVLRPGFGAARCEDVGIDGCLVPIVERLPTASENLAFRVTNGACQQAVGCQMGLKRRETCV